MKYLKDRKRIDFIHRDEVLKELKIVAKKK